MKKYSVVFAGTPDFACPGLQALIKDKRFDVQAIISQPDKPVGRKQIITPPPVKVLAESYGISVYQPQKIQEIELELKNITPDFFIVIAYGQIFPSSILNIAKWNINLHFSLLPKYRGASPIQSALLDGEKETGVSIMNIEERMDAGGVYKVHSIPIRPEDTTASLFEKLGDLGKYLPDDLEEIALGLETQIQHESKATYCKKIQKQDGEITWERESAESIFHKLQAFTPWPGIFFIWKGKRIKILSGKVFSMDFQGKDILQKNNDGLYFFQTQKGAFIPQRIIPEGKKEIDFQEWVRNILL